MGESHFAIQSVHTVCVSLEELLEVVFVKYVVSDEFPPTTHSDDTTLMIFGVSKWYFMCLCNFWTFIRSQIPYRYTGDSGEVDVRQNMCGVPVFTWIRQKLKYCDGSWEHKSSEINEYNRKFEWFSGGCCFTNTHMMVVTVVVRQIMCGVPGWTWIRYISIITGLWWWKLRG